MIESVILTVSAKSDIRRVLKWIEPKSRPGAEAWFRSWMGALKRLEEAPNALGFAPENEDHKPAIRQIIFKTRSGLPYRALFIVRDGCAYVLRVRGPGQDLVGEDDLTFP